MCETEQLWQPRVVWLLSSVSSTSMESWICLAKLGKNGLAVNSETWCESMEKSALFCKVAPKFQVLLCLHKHTWNYQGIITSLSLRNEPNSCGRFQGHFWICAPQEIQV